MAKRNLERSAPELLWDRFHGKAVDVALPEIYREAVAASQKTRAWYWYSIRSKKRWSLVSRGVSYLLGVVGVATPLLAAIGGDAESKLVWTQAGVVALALAGLAQLGDSVFGWSGGWQRYITTATAMERLAMQFELEWASYLVARSGGLDAGDLKPLFELGKTLQVETEKRQSEETDAWVAEFNAGMAALNEMLKTQREATQKAAETARVANENQAQASKKGAIQLDVAGQTQPPEPLTVSVDGQEKAVFAGSSWAMLDVEPGLHSVRVVAAAGTPAAFEATSAVQVTAGALATVAIKLP